MRLEVSNEASPIRNIGNCRTSQRMRSSARLPRNESQNAANGSNDALENITDVMVVRDIIEAFKDISEPNTRANPKKETGGYLLGRRLENGYIIDTLLIPKQNGYSDYFETTNEDEISNFVNSDPGLVLLGLIHTHPGFDSFLSSVDLHMLHRYILEDPSVISIVLAPEQNDFPAFSLTRTGLLCLNECRRESKRPHRHDRTALYRLANHVHYINDGHIRVEDQR